MADEETKVEEVVVETPETTTPKTPKTYTDEEVNAISAKAKTSERIALLKELGIEDAKDAKEALKKYKESEDAKKTEAEKLQEAIKTEQTKATTAEQRATIAESKLDAITLGVKTELADKFVKLAMTYEGETVTDKLNAVLKDFPEFKGGSTLDKFGNAIKNEGEKTLDKVAEEFAKAMG